jgi:hypothetical protein
MNFRLLACREYEVLFDLSGVAFKAEILGILKAWESVWQKRTLFHCAEGGV